MCNHNNKTETSRRREGSRNGSNIELRSGREGPRHDPYHYDELTLRRSDGRWATVHIGLAEWMEYFDGRVKRRFEDSATVLNFKFEAVMGVSTRTVYRALHEIGARRIRNHKCGQRHLDWVSGYPGEELLYCNECGTVLDSSFNLSAVM